MHTPILEEIQPTKGVKYFRQSKNTKRQKTVMLRCLKFVLACKDSQRFINASTRNYGGQAVLYVNYYLRSV